MSEIVGLASQFATQNCFGCYSKLNLGIKFHAEVATHLPRIKLRALYIFVGTCILYYYGHGIKIMFIAILSFYPALIFLILCLFIFFTTPNLCVNSDAVKDGLTSDLFIILGTFHIDCFIFLGNFMLILLSWALHQNYVAGTCISYYYI